MEAVRCYLKAARSGDSEAAFFGLLELAEDPIPTLQEAYWIEPDPTVRALIVEIAWQRRNPSTIPFLADALGDYHPETWKQALDGLVTLGTPEARRALETASGGSTGLDAERRAWIAEAIGQLSSPEWGDLWG